MIRSAEGKPDDDGSENNAYRRCTCYRRTRFL